MNDLKTQSANLGDHHVAAPDITGGMAQRLGDAGAPVVQHLYVYDGDVKTEDRIAKQIDAIKATNLTEAARLAKLVKGTPAAAALAHQSELAKVYGAARAEAIALSRQETVANAEDRSGSRDLYVKTFVPLAARQVAAVRAVDLAVRARSPPCAPSTWRCGPPPTRRSRTRSPAPAPACAWSAGSRRSRC